MSPGVVFELFFQRYYWPFRVKRRGGFQLIKTVFDGQHCLHVQHLCWSISLRIPCCMKAVLGKQRLRRRKKRKKRKRKIGGKKERKGEGKGKGREKGKTFGWTSTMIQPVSRCIIASLLVVCVLELVHHSSARSILEPDSCGYQVLP